MRVAPFTAVNNNRNFEFFNLKLGVMVFSNEQAVNGGKLFVCINFL